MAIDFNANPLQFVLSLEKEKLDSICEMIFSQRLDENKLKAKISTLSGGIFKVKQKHEAPVSKNFLDTLHVFSRFFPNFRERID